MIGDWRFVICHAASQNHQSPIINRQYPETLVVEPCLCLAVAFCLYPINKSRS